MGDVVFIQVPMPRRGLIYELRTLQFVLPRGVPAGEMTRIGLSDGWFVQEHELNVGQGYIRDAYGVPWYWYRQAKDGARGAFESIKHCHDTYYQAAEEALRKHMFPARKASWSMSN